MTPAVVLLGTVYLFVIAVLVVSKPLTSAIEEPPPHVPYVYVPGGRVVQGSQILAPGEQILAPDEAVNNNYRQSVERHLRWCAELLKNIDREEPWTTDDVSRAVYLLEFYADQYAQHSVGTSGIKRRMMTE